MEKISKYQKILPLFLQREYIKYINYVVVLEIDILKKVMNFSFQNQILKHESHIFELQNLQEHSSENFQNILELQKIRLEKQKENFEKFLKI